MATTDRFLKLLAANTDEELEKEIAAMQDNQKDMLIKAFVKMLKSNEAELSPMSKELREIFGK